MEGTVTIVTFHVVSCAKTDFALAKADPRKIEFAQITINFFD